MNMPRYILRLFINGQFTQQIGAFNTLDAAIAQKKIEELRDMRVRVRVYEMREVEVL